MHAEIAKINVEEVIKAGPIRAEGGLRSLMWLFVFIGIVTFSYALFAVPAANLWGAYYVNLLFFMGLSVGGVVLSVIFQIVRARWAAPIRRIVEANVSFFPWAFILFLCSYAGKEVLFPWARAPMPGREWWMQADFVYGRFAVLLAVLFFVLWRFVRLSLRADIGMARERTGGFHGWIYDHIAGNWQGLEKEVAVIQPRMSRVAPVLIACYAVIYSLFAFEMVMAMDTTWYSNMFGGFIFIGNIYLAWAVLSMTITYLGSRNRNYAKVLSPGCFWDIGKLTFAFCMLWGYLFFSQFLPQWYGNLPEETQWLILRTRDWTLPWVKLAWFVFPMCFVFPFITLISRDVKRTPKYISLVALVIFFGIWLEKYLIVVPSLSPTTIPFGFTEVGLFLGFLGAYVLSIQSFLSTFPFVPVSHPTTHGRVDW